MKKIGNKKVVVKEKGRKLEIVNDHCHVFTIIKYDGCCVHNEIAADFVIIDQDKIALIVELKGRNVEHGLKQVFQTADKLLQFNTCNPPISALILSRQCPKASTAVQRAKISFRQKYKGIINICTGDRCGSFDSYTYR